MYTITVIIRSIGIFSKAIKRILGEEQLLLLFSKLIELSDNKLLKVLEYNIASKEFSFADEIQRTGVNMKTILYHQKSLTSFLISYSNLIVNLSKISDSEAQHLYQLSILAIKLHNNFFSKYKEYLYDAIVSLITSMKVHNNIFYLWLKKLVSESLFESLKLSTDDAS